eukprot:2564752-Pyramimonas_sp.AAC.1
MVQKSWVIIIKKCRGSGPGARYVHECGPEPNLSGARRESKWGTIHRMPPGARPAKCKARARPSAVTDGTPST